MLVLAVPCESAEEDSRSAASRWLGATAPDLTRDAYWDAHGIRLARVVELRTEERLSGPRVSYVLKVLSTLGEAATVDELVLPEEGLSWILKKGERAIPVLRPDDVVVVFSPVGTSVDSFASRIEPGGRFRFGDLQQIADLRDGKGGLAALTEGMFHGSRDVSLYCLRRMQSRVPPDVEGVMRRLDAVGQDKGRPPEARVLAIQLRWKLKALPAPERWESPLEYRMVRTAFLEADDEEILLRPFCNRLIEFESMRVETVELLTKLATDGSARPNVRRAAWRALSDWRLLNGLPDAVGMDRVLGVGVVLAMDSDPVVRGAGEGLLTSMKGSAVAGLAVDPDRVERIARKIEARISEAMAGEPPGVVEGRLRRLREMEADTLEGVRWEMESKSGEVSNEAVIEEYVKRIAKRFGKR